MSKSPGSTQHSRLGWENYLLGCDTIDATVGVECCTAQLTTQVFSATLNFELWQLHRPDLNEGMVLAFRHQDCPYSSMQVNLKAVNPEQTYVVNFIDEQHRSITKIMPGRELTTVELHIPVRHESLLLRHAPEKN